MIQLDENFLKSVGLDSLPDEQKKPFLQHIYDELEVRVGSKLAEGLSDGQLSQFEKIIDRDSNEINDWLEKNDVDYNHSDRYRKIRSSNTDDLSAKSEYAAARWLEINRPDYQSVVAKALDELKIEITNNKDTILGNN